MLSSRWITVAVVLGASALAVSVQPLQRVEIQPVEDKGLHSWPGNGGKWVPSVIIFPLPPNVPEIFDPLVIENNEWVPNNDGGQSNAHLANIYPAVLEIPEDADTLELHFFMAAVNATGGLVPLPANLSVQAATVTGLGGTVYTASLTPISGLGLLPTSTALSPVIQWDLTQFDQTVGAFNLARVELPIADVPEPASLAVLFGGGWLLMVRRRR